VALRRNQRLSYEHIAARVGLCRSVVARACKRASPGELRHRDTKKPHRFDKPVHRITGDRIQNTPRAGFNLLLAHEKATSACAFLLTA